MSDGEPGSKTTSSAGGLIPVYCNDCGRANGAEAKRCIWCGLPIRQGSLQRFETTRVEIGYLGGIDKLEELAPVRLVISAAGMEVSSLEPGSRPIKISAYSILDARVVDASTVIEGARKRAAWWWWLVVGPFALAIPGKKLPDIKKHDYILSIRYNAGNEVRSAVFHREDRVGLSMVEGLARIISALVQRTARHSYPSP